jgi:hypothetical protein
MSNPLSNFFRQPALHLKLPSIGRFWEENSLNLPVTGEIPVFPMTAYDDIIIKTPDALLNGSGVVSIVQSCCPNIVNAWQAPACDLDAILIAIRIASYGPTLNFTSDCPQCKTTNQYGMDLNLVLSGIKIPDYDMPVETKDLKIYLKPQTYKNVNAASLLAFEERQTLRLLVDSGISEEEKKQRFDSQVKKISSLTIDAMANSTDYIETVDGVKVNDHNHINEFYQNTGYDTIAKIRERLNSITEENAIKPASVKCEGCSKEFTSAFEFNYSNFFVTGS